MANPLRVTGAFALAGAGYWFFLRPVSHRWGATAAELARTYPGDDAVSLPDHEATMAVTVHARPEEIWPWINQIGTGRGGLYSYDWLDRLFGYLDENSADEILPGLPELKAGDRIPIGHDPRRFFPVRSAERNLALVLAGRDEASGLDWSWSIFLVPVDEERTRLLSRNRVHIPRGLKSRMVMAWMEPAAFVMTRRMLLGIRERAERLAARRRHVPAIRSAPAPMLH